eukprot:CAMPEP_0184668376 /NCGR_PEP_ID=MMETSP0308-20130426/72135_1 /TAXON_ID=38269 /ORGANISM="Gloeochaete witrockiana, Strain SAG 46.84" /LENGTH=152 /DNA_ID=CAMNT_0027114069 /DNA_START=32 /DNA_END=486 /DNA_ORIENTATION=+
MPASLPTTTTANTTTTVVGGGVISASSKRAEKSALAVERRASPLSDRTNGPSRATQNGVKEEKTSQSQPSNDNMETVVTKQRRTRGSVKEGSLRKEADAVVTVPNNVRRTRSKSVKDSSLSGSGRSNGLAQGEENEGMGSRRGNGIESLREG